MVSADCDLLRTLDEYILIGTAAESYNPENTVTVAVDQSPSSSTKQFTSISIGRKHFTGTVVQYVRSHTFEYRKTVESA
jgi:hypothetical protein